MGPDLRFDSFRGLVLLHPLQVKVVAHPFFAFSQDDDHAPLTHRQPGIVHGLLKLIHVDVFGIAAAGGDHQVGQPVDGSAIDAFHELAGLEMGLDVVPGVNLQKFLFLVQDHIEKKGRPLHFRPFHLVFVGGIPLQLSGDRPRFQHEGVVAADGVIPGDSGEQRFPAPAEPAEKMIHHAPRADDVICLHGPFMEVNVVSPRGPSYELELGRIMGVAVVHPNPSGGFLPGHLGHFVLGEHAVGPHGKHDEHVLVGNPRRVQLVQQNGHKHMAVGDPRRVVDQEADRLAGLHDLAERPGMNRVPDGLLDFPGRVLEGGVVPDGKFSDHQLGVQVKTDGSPPVLKIIFFRGHHPPSFLLTAHLYEFFGSNFNLILP